ncbi:hypothetical protein [Nitrobacter sp. JJSN]|uniref:hypothetical protein n=1 Tax=Nitrobacter sp. JJSN TaxID=3453033 RepID=UPI003F762FC3
MPLKIRMLPPVSVGQQTQTINGRFYNGQPGIAYDIADMDAPTLAANGWITCAPSGTTAQRPTTNPNTNPPYVAAPNFEYFDTTISKLIFWDGATWRDPVTGSAV